jgi:hypothetical protein
MRSAFALVQIRQRQRCRMYPFNEWECSCSMPCAHIRQIAMSLSLATLDVSHRDDSAANSLAAREEQSSA